MYSSTPDPSEFAQYENLVLPAGWGHVVRIKRNTNRPYCARRYSHTDQNGVPRNIELGYFSTRGEAVYTLVKLRERTTQQVRNYKLTFAEVFDIWYADAKTRYSPSTLACYRHNFRQCESLHHKAYRSITAQDMQRIISQENSGTNQRRMVNLLTKLDITADSLDIIEKRNTDFLSSMKLKEVVPTQRRMPFSDSEVYRLLEHSGEPGVPMVLFLLYTGLRSGEVCELRKDNVDLDHMFLTGGKKTPAGCGRIIPIHPRIAEFLKASMASGRSEYLFGGPRGGKPDRKKLEEDFKSTCGRYCDLPHIPHECRHSFQTRLDMMQADRIAVDLLMGHKSANRMDSIYSHRSPEDLRKVISKLW